MILRSKKKKKDGFYRRDETAWGSRDEYLERRDRDRDYPPWDRRYGRGERGEREEEKRDLLPRNQVPTAQVVFFFVFDLLYYINK